MDKKGLYLHFPFCISKCAYCDFYSSCENIPKISHYLTALKQEMLKYKAEKCDTLYLGGGTPTVIGTENLCDIITYAKNLFPDISDITLEANPADNLKELFKSVKECGVTRISLGMQSANDNELKILSRRHNCCDVKKAVEDIKSAGINDFSLDIMLGIPNQTESSLKSTLDFAVSLNPTHLSAYMLKIEDGTPFKRLENTLKLPDEDKTAEFYLYTVEYLEKQGYHQYEISNFSKNGYESRHNLKYWRGQEYVGIGPAAHGYLNGKRYFYERDIDSFINAPQRIFDGDGGGIDEFIMLSLRLNSGLDTKILKEKCGNIPDEFLKRADYFAKLGLVRFQNGILSLTKEGFLVSNTIISELLATL